MKILNFSFILGLFVFAQVPVYAQESKISDIPETLTALQKITDKSSYEYETLAYKAALDTVSAGQEALSSFDSARALKLLSVGAKILPWRNDVINLRNTAIETYIKITNSYITSKSCNEIPGRIKYLKEIAPDGLTQINKLPEECKIENVILKSTTDSIAEILSKSNIDTIINSTEPTKNAELEKSNFTDLPSQLTYIVERNKNFPIKDFENMQDRYILEFWKNFSFSCSDLHISPNATSEVNFEVFANCELSKDYSLPSKETFGAIFNDYAKVTENLLAIPGADKRLVLRSKYLEKEAYIYTSEPINKKFPYSWFLEEDDLLIFDIYSEDEKGLTFIRKTGLSLIADTPRKNAARQHPIYQIMISPNDLNPVYKSMDTIFSEYQKDPSFNVGRFYTEALDFMMRPIPEKYESIDLIPGKKTKIKYVFNSIKDVSSFKKLVYVFNAKETYLQNKKYNYGQRFSDLIEEKRNYVPGGNFQTQSYYDLLFGMRRTWYTKRLHWYMYGLKEMMAESSQSK